MSYVGNDEIIRVTEGQDDVFAIYRGDTQVFQTPVIEFDDDNVKAICVANWGGNIIPDEITPMEAAAVTTLVPSGGSQSAFRSNTSIETFNELKYFTGLTTLNAAFRDCTNLTQITFPAAPLSGNTCLTDCVGKTKVEVVDLRPLKINQSVAVNVRLHVDSSAEIEEVYFPQMKVRTLYYAFWKWTKLKKIDFSRCDFGSMGATVGSQSTTASTFGDCTSLTTIVGGLPNTKQSVPLGACSALTHDSALAVLNSLGTRTSGTATVTFHSNVHLTSEEVAIGTGKGFTVTGYTLDAQVTTNLENVTCNAPSMVSGSLTATLTATSGNKVQENSVIVTMGGNDITSTAYDHSTKTITISRVTGDISITAVGRPYDAEVEWLRGDGTAYIDTGIKNKYTVNIKADVRIESSSATYILICGARISVSSSQNAIAFYYANGFLYRYNTTTIYARGTTVFGDYTIETQSYSKFSVLRVSGAATATATITQSATFSNTFNYLLFNFSNNGTAMDAAGTGLKIKNFKMYRDSVLVRDYIPVRENGVGYMYDKVSGQLFGNVKSTGAFTYGNDVTR